MSEQPAERQASRHAICGPCCLPSNRLGGSTAVAANDGDCNILLLVLLYIMQGIPLGLIAIMPHIILEGGGTFKQQAKFSFITWAFALKMVLAPFVDLKYIPRLGRRKTWLMAMQFMMAINMMWLSMEVKEILTSSVTDAIITRLTIICFGLNLFVATQDIAVDCWALKMAKYSGYTYVCDIFGIFVGFIIGYIFVPSLESPGFCNMYLRKEPQDEGIITMSNSIWYLAIAYIVLTILIAFSKEARDTRISSDMNIIDSYRILFNMLRSPAIQMFALMLVTEKIAFVPFEAMNELKLLEQGFTRTQLSVINAMVYLLQLCVLRFLSIVVSSTKPLDSYFTLLPLRILVTTFGSLVTYSLPYFAENGIRTIDLCLYFVIGATHKLCICGMSIAKAKYFTSFVEPTLGGTNLAFLHALTCVGGLWPNVLALYVVDGLTLKKCKSPGDCTVILDGYYVEIVVAGFLGMLWLKTIKHCLYLLHSLPRSQWMR